MSELRRDPLRRRWVVIADDRSRRPRLMGHRAGRVALDEGGPCPFCGSHEDARPVIGRVEGPQGEVHVVPNRFPAFRVEAQLEPTSVGQHDRLGGLGAHEVVIETPRHDEDWVGMPIEQLAAVLLAWRDRIRDLHRDRRLVLVSAFRNHGAAAGASLAHPHSQVVATPVVPPLLEAEIENAELHHRQHGRCLQCDLLHQEFASRERVVRVDEGYLSYCPYASAVPFEVQVVPRKHRHDFGALAPSEAQGLAVHLRDVLRRLSWALDDPAYNLTLVTAPSEHGLPIGNVGPLLLPRIWHWRIEIAPRLEPGGGFEWLTGMHINPTPPESAAQHLRDLDLR